MLRSEILRTYDFFIYKLITICLITVAGNLFVHINSEIIEYKFLKIYKVDVIEY